jgi:hypothetical protein
MEAAEAQAELSATVKREILPRSVNPDAIVRLSKFPKASASVVYKSGDGEANAFANDVRNGLLKAGWDVPDLVMPISANPLVSRDDALMGVRVYTHDEWLDFTHVRLPKGKDTRDMALMALLTNGFGGWQSTRLNGLPGFPPVLPENSFLIVIGQRYPEVGPPHPETQVHPNRVPQKVGTPRTASLSRRSKNGLWGVDGMSINVVAFLWRSRRS